MNYYLQGPHLNKNGHTGGDHRNPVGRPKTGRIKFSTTIYPDTRNDLQLYAKHMGMQTNRFIEYLLDYYISTENAIEHAQMAARKRERDMPPHLRKGIKIFDPSFDSKVYRDEI
jgi:hypothetical protein